MGNSSDQPILDSKIVETLLIPFIDFIAETQGLYFSKERSIINAFIDALKIKEQ